MCFISSLGYLLPRTSIQILLRWIIIHYRRCHGCSIMVGLARSSSSIVSTMSLDILIIRPRLLEVLVRSRRRWRFVLSGTLTFGHSGPEPRPLCLLLVVNRLALNSLGQKSLWKVSVVVTCALMICRRLLFELARFVLQINVSPIRHAILAIVTGPKSERILNCLQISCPWTRITSCSFNSCRSVRIW